MLKKIIPIIFAFFSLNALAGKPECHSSSGGYCTYYGYVKKVYVNAFNDILVYFDTPMDDGEWEKAGFNATQKSAAIRNIDENPEFARMLYSTLLAAQSSKRPVSVQMRNVRSGYLIIDRIWLSE